MRDSSLNRWMWLLGLAAVAAVFVGFGPLGSGSPGENASGVSVAHWYNTHVAQSWASIYAVGLGLALILVFITQLRSVLRDAGGERLWPNVVFASGIIFITGIVVAGSTEITLILASHNNEFGIVKVMNFLGDNNELLFIAGMCFLALSTGLAILLNRRVAPLPKLLGWYSLLVGVVAAAGPLAFLDLLFGLPIWFLAIGIVIAVKARRATLATADSAGSGPTNPQKLQDATPVTT